MTAPAAISLTTNRELADLNRTAYALAYRGKPLPEVKVLRVVDADSGFIHLYIEAPKQDGKPVLNNAQMDAVARHHFGKPEVRAYAQANGSARLIRRYARP